MNKPMKRLLAFLLLISMLAAAVPGLAESEAPKLNLSETEVCVPKGKNHELFARIRDTKAVYAWRSDNEEIATVCSKGIVSGKADGKTVVTCTATLKDGTVLSESCGVTVYTMVKRIRIPDRITVGVGAKTDPVQLTVIPEDASDRTVSWTTDNPEIATVDKEGRILGLKAGTCLLIAESNEGRHYGGKGLKARCKVTVVQFAEEISADPAELSIEKGQRERISAVVLPENAKNKTLIWESLDRNIPEVKNGQIAGKSAGDTSSRIYVKNPDGSVVEKLIPVHVTAPGAQQTEP